MRLRVRAWLVRSIYTTSNVDRDGSLRTGEDESWVACGHGSDCINRLTQVECVVGECRCRKYCQNQRYEASPHPHLVVANGNGFQLPAETICAY